MDRGELGATVHRVTKSWTKLKRLSTHARTHCPLPIRREKCWRERMTGKEFVHQEVRKCISLIPGYWKRPWCWERLKAGGEGTTENETVGWRHQFNGLDFEQARGVDDGQGNLVCCSPWGRRVRHEWATELNWIPGWWSLELLFRNMWIWFYIVFKFWFCALFF